MITQFMCGMFRYWDSSHLQLVNSWTSTTNRHSKNDQQKLFTSTERIPYYWNQVPFIPGGPFSAYGVSKWPFWGKRGWSRLFSIFEQCKCEDYGSRSVRQIAGSNVGTIANSAFGLNYDRLQTNVCRLPTMFLERHLSIARVHDNDATFFTLVEL